MDKKLNIFIATDTYPPELGGPAEYAKNLKDVWVSKGHTVQVRVFSKFNKYPWGVRHLMFLNSVLSRVARADMVLALGVFSAGTVTIVSKIFNLKKKVIFRTGGDFVWESYVERTGDLVLLRDFYKTKLDKLSKKENLIFKLTRWMLRKVNIVVWSTDWQKNIFLGPYGLQNQRSVIIENYYGPKVPNGESKNKDFVGSTRKLKWKNIDLLQSVFNREDIRNTGVTLYTQSLNHSDFLEKIKNSYAVIVASLGDISPNTILDAIRLNKPFIVTKETGLHDRIKDIALFVDPKNPNDIAEKVLWLSNRQNYEEQKRKIEAWNFTHTWEQMADEYIDLYKKL
jgi:hypothetical protein